MRHVDFTPLYRTTIGFDRLASLLDNVLAAETAQGGYPPYNIEKTGEDAYRITVAVAGFSEDELSVETRDGQLTISGRKVEDEQERGRTFLHRGIAARAFEKRFQLADHVRAVGARIENGLLHVDLVREVPEALKPRRIEIVSDAPRKAAIRHDAPAAEEAQAVPSDAAPAEAPAQA
ncbi:Hsp20 family protein [Oceanicella actignis]|uniref:Molecular chaperone IbpA n=1 Tax=Oceanicella actignis TaxID=1189325 RepID=A0A1M7TL08_9RHOB|nr:Hsp20 family protein [Oceanicella actignis]SET68743.1 molecular chaperone IbpA [Oceanicella actignis]SHN71328.1 molecular chaperone IbpA [Oceanicella actignis]